MSEKKSTRPDETASVRKVWNAEAHIKEKPVSKVYPVIDSDLARDNLENDLTAADLQDL